MARSSDLLLTGRLECGQGPTGATEISVQERAESEDQIECRELGKTERKRRNRKRDGRLPKKKRGGSERGPNFRNKAKIHRTRRIGNGERVTTGRALDKYA